MDLFETIRQRERAAIQLKAELEQARQAENERQQRIETDRQKSPAERFLPAHAERLRKPQERSPAPVVEAETKTKVAEQVKAQPNGLQRAPSPGGPGVIYCNPRAWRPPDLSCAQESLLDQAKRERQEARAGKTEEELANERCERAQRDLDRFLDLPRR